MPFIVADRVKETTTTTGTGSYTLAGAVANFRAFSSVCANTDTVNYAAVDNAGAGWEVGLGTWSTGGTLARTTIYASSNGGSAVNWSAGTREIFLTAAATFLASRAASGANSDITSLTGLTTALSVGQGGTGAATLTANNVLLGNGTSAVQSVAPGTSGNVLTSNGTTWLSQPGGGGGLSFFTEATNTAAPNATVPVNSFSATGAAANIDVAIVPKGTGAFSLAVANNATSGGEKRGANAVDLQTSRLASGGVASGQFSAVLSGANNRASAFGAVVVGGGASGSGNLASGRGSFVGGGGTSGGRNTASGEGSVVVGGAGAGGGSDNTASGNWAFIGGGWGHTASADNSVVTGGTGNIANGANSTIPGGVSGTTNSISGLMAYGFDNALFAPGRHQMAFFGARRETTDATTQRATANGAAAAATNQLTLRNNSAFAFRGRVVARDTSTNDMKAWEFVGAIKRGANAGTTAIVGTPTITVIAEDTNASTWTIALLADTTNGSLAVNVTGQAAKTIRWTVVIHSAEVN
jgi:hypothetical protein